jgi:PAS domain S-box-containing protein
MILDRTPEKDKAGPADFCPATDLQHAEAALRASEEKYRTILEDIDEGYFEIDLKGNFTFVNDVLCRDLGYPRRELIGMNYRQYMENSMARMSQTVFAELYAAGQASGRYEGEFIEKSGAKHFCEVSVSLLRDVRGRPIGFRGLSRNITKRKRSEEALRHNEYFLRKSQEVARLGSFDFHVKTGLWISSPTLDNLLGIGKDYIKNVRGWFGLIHPDDREELKSDLEQGLARKLPLVEKEFRVLRNSDGRELWVRYRGEATFDQNGAPERLIGTIQDITEHRLMQKKLIESEQKYRSIVENAQEGIFHAAPRERPLSANAAFAALLGYDSPEDLARSVASIAGQIYVHPDEYHAVLKKVRGRRRRQRLRDPVLPQRPEPHLDSDERQRGPGRPGPAGLLPRLRGRHHPLEKTGAGTAGQHQQPAQVARGDDPGPVRDARGPRSLHRRTPAPGGRSGPRHRHGNEPLPRPDRRHLAWPA